MDLLSNINPAILVSALVFGAVSSLHCFAMCGPLAFQAKDQPLRQLSYQLGRFLSYQIMGFLIFFLANSVFSEIKQSLQEYTLMVLVGIYLAIGLQIVLRKKNSLPSDHFFSKLYNKSFKKLNQLREKSSFSFGLGLISGLIPCGLLHTFLLGVIPLQSMTMVFLFIACFWMATAPALTLSVFSLSYLKKRFAGSLTTLQGLSFIALSLYTLYLKHQAVLAGQCQ